MQNKRLNLIHLFSVVGLFGLSFFFGYSYKEKDFMNEFSSIKQVRAKNDKYPLVNRLIGTEMPEATKIGFYIEAKNDIEKLYKKDEYKNIKKFSMYFRDLNTGLWFGINENDEYIPASLFKLPIGIAYYRDSLDNSNLFNGFLQYTKKESSEINSILNLDTTSLTLNNSYKVDFLIKKMLIESDNGAQLVLMNNINNKILDKVYSLVEVDGPEQNHYYISPKEYAFFLRMLYNGSFLGLEKSQEILETLEGAIFPYGIRKSVPTDIRVVHKYGSVNINEESGKDRHVGIHDCGIVYYPEKHYILCIMTESTNQKDSIKLIEDVSQYMFKYISKNK